MEGRGIGSAAVALAVMFAMSMLPEAAAQVRYRVGDGEGQGWSPRDENLTSYTVWAEGKHFYVGDWLYFVYDRFGQNVLQVNQSGYDNCISDNFMGNYTTGAGRDVVELNKTGTYYFISTNGCYNGMKLAVNVENPPPPPSSSPKQSDGSCLSSFRAQAVLPALVAVGAVWDSLLMIL